MQARLGNYTETYKVKMIDPAIAKDRAELNKWWLKGEKRTKKRLKDFQIMADERHVSLEEIKKEWAEGKFEYRY